MTLLALTYDPAAKQTMNTEVIICRPGQDDVPTTIPGDHSLVMVHEGEPMTQELLSGFLQQAFRYTSPLSDSLAKTVLERGEAIVADGLSSEMAEIMQDRIRNEARAVSQRMPQVYAMFQF